jgi:hypothetical protein
VPELSDGDWAGAAIAHEGGLEAASGETSTDGVKLSAADASFTVRIPSWLLTP